MPSNKLQVVLDGETLTECEEDRCEYGYTYDRDHQTVRLEGQDCLTLQDGTCHTLTFSG